MSLNAHDLQRDLRDCYDEKARLRAALVVIGKHARVRTWRRPNHSAPVGVRVAYSRGVTRGYAEMAKIAKAALDNKEEQT